MEGMETRPLYYYIVRGLWQSCKKHVKFFQHKSFVAHNVICFQWYGKDYVMPHITYSQYDSITSNSYTVFGKRGLLTIISNS